MLDVQKRPDGIVVLVLNTDGPVNTLSAKVGEALGRAVGTLEADADLKGVVLSSAKDGFAAGGDLAELRAAQSPVDVAAIVDGFANALRRLEKIGKPVVAALNGTALGGGYEFALAAHRRIAARRADATFGLPEVGLGLMPGAGGTQRLPRLIGIAAAADLILGAKTLPIDEALAAGLIDEVAEPGELLSAAIAWIEANPEANQPWDRRGFVAPGDDPNSQKGRIFFAGAWAQMRRRSGGTDEAATAVLYALHHGMERQIDAGLAIERRQFIHLAVQPSAKNKIRTLFFGPRAAVPKPPAGAGEGYQTIGVIGGGTMGNGIAFAAARAGLDVRIIDVTPEKAAESATRIAAIADRQVARGRMSGAARDALLARIKAGADFAELAHTDMVVEAVFERLDVKHEVLANAAAVLRPGVTIASNTSTIPIGQLSCVLAEPSRMVGMHFFAPVETMKLLEVIHSPATSARAAADAEWLAKVLKKSVILINDGLGFYTSRIVSSLTSEALTLIAEGVPAQIVDNVMINSGFAIGPATLADLTKLSLLRDIMTSMSGEGMPQSMRGGQALVALAALIGAGREGKLTGAGIFDYVDGQPRLWPGLVGLFPPSEGPLDPDIVRQRLLHTQSLEAVRALVDGTVRDPLTADMAASTGWGYPSRLGGPFGYIDTLGAGRFVNECDALAERFGERFEVPQRLREMAASGLRFHPV